MMDIYLYPTHPVRCIITGPSESGQSIFFNKFEFKILLTNMIKYTSTHLVFIKIYIKNQLNVLVIIYQLT